LSTGKTCDEKPPQGTITAVNTSMKKKPGEEQGR